MGSSGCFPGD